MKKIALILSSLIVFGMSPAFGATEYTIFKEYGFYLEYPSDWEIVDNWNKNSKIFFNADYLGKTKVIISYEESTRDLSSINDDLLAYFEDALYEECRVNKNGPCWDFKLLDSKIITVGQTKGISVKYQETLEDQLVIIRSILLPDGKNNWAIQWKAVENGIEFEEQLEKTVNSFSLNDKKETQLAPIKIPTPVLSDPDITVQRNYNVNLILIGEEWPRLVRSEIQDNLPNYREPVYVVSQEKIGVRHNYNYNFVSISGDSVQGLSKFMTDNSESIPIIGSNVIDLPIWQAYWVVANHPEWVEFDQTGNVAEYKIDYRLVDALATEEYLYEKFIGSNPELSKPNSVNLIFLNMDLEEANFLRNYFIESQDDASGKDFSAIGLMGYGGNYNVMFFDLYAAPWFDIDLDSLEYSFPPWVETLHDCNSSQCLADLVAYHTGEALRYVISPHLLYPVSNADKYIIETLVYTKPGGSNTVTPQTMKKFAEDEKIRKELEFLYPHSEWEINYNLERRDTRGLSYEFKKALENTSHFTFESLFGNERSIQLLQTEYIKPYLIDWGVKERGDTEEISEILVLIEIDSSDKFDVYLDDFGVLGIAPSMPDSDEACCAFGVTSQKKLWKEQIGFTDLLIHEVGHTLGLMHPFMSIDEFGDTTVNYYFNWYSSPMTYSFPNSGCGLLFSLIYSDPCGNASLSFTEFEKNIISDARLAGLWEQTESNLEQLDNTQDTQSLLQDSKVAYQNGDVYSLQGSLVLAKEAYQASKTKELKIIPKSDDVSKVPDWVKNNAKWWADGQIDDDSFVSGIQHLIKENIISIPKTIKSDIISDQQVPEWVKNNAKWWADGQIQENDFLTGIEFLAKNGIIKVN